MHQIILCIIKTNYILGNKKQDIKKDYIDLVGKKLNIIDTKNILLEYIS